MVGKFDEIPKMNSITQRSDFPICTVWEVIPVDIVHITIIWYDAKAFSEYYNVVKIYTCEGFAELRNLVGHLIYPLGLVISMLIQIIH